MNPANSNSSHEENNESDSESVVTSRKMSEVCMNGPPESEIFLFEPPREGLAAAAALERFLRRTISIS